MMLIKNKKEWLDYEDGFRYYKQETKDEPTHYPVLAVSQFYTLNGTYEYVRFEFIYEEYFNE